MINDISQRQGSAGLDNCNDGFTGFMKRTDQVSLVARKVDIGARVRFA